MKKVSLLLIGNLLFSMFSCNIPEKEENQILSTYETKTNSSPQSSTEIDPDKIVPPTHG